MRMLRLEHLPLEVNRRLKITGVVQGVGFRPFVYQLAERYGLNGFIKNDSSGVSVEIEGSQSNIDTCIKALYDELPPLARIDSLTSEEIAYVGHESFEILSSDTDHTKSALVSPDIAICENCLEEMNDLDDRRYDYPFINCTNCGPRYSIMESLPYDRPYTSMRSFTLCEACNSEYTDPLDRRFHAQPISCYDCGPTLKLLNHTGKVLTKGKNALLLTVQSIQRGDIVAVKGLGGFHLFCDATNTEAVEKLRERKDRPVKPFAVMFKDMATLKTSVQLSAQEKNLICSKEKPIVIVPKRIHSAISEAVAPKIDRLGVFIAYTPLHHLLIDLLNVPLVATSANRRDEPIIREGEALIEKLGSVVDRVLDHDREIVNANDDSVVQIAADQKITLRMARGYAPKSIKLPFKSKKKILAVGANQKNSIALIFEDTLILSPHIGDLNSLEAFEYFERTLETFKDFYDFEPEVIVYDKHPEYMTTQWAKAFKAEHPKVETIEVQHHYAHLLAGLAEFNVDKKVLGFVFDGTGYGDDGTIWGGEVMLADAQNYERIFSLAPFRLLGGEKAIKEPRRAALSLLFDTFTLEVLSQLDLPLLKTFSTEEIKFLHGAWEKGINAPLTSSMGRLFDAVASLADIVHLSSFEGESGLIMEQYVDDAITGSFPFSIENDLIKWEDMIEEIVIMHDKRVIVSMFFNTLIEMIFMIAKKYPDMALLFSGGVFQNRVLVEKILRRGKEEERSVYFQNETPINDGGVALGQAWYGLHRFKDK